MIKKAKNSQILAVCADILNLNVVGTDPSKWQTLAKKGDAILDDDRLIISDGDDGEWTFNPFHSTIKSLMVVSEVGCEIAITASTLKTSTVLAKKEGITACGASEWWASLARQITFSVVELYILMRRKEDPNYRLDIEIEEPDANP